MDVHGQVSALRNSWRNSINIFTDISNGLQLIPAQQKKLNKLRKQAGNEAINFEQFKGVCC